MDKIGISHVELFCNIGLTQEERKNKQPLIIDVFLYLDLSLPARTQNIQDTINYSQVYADVKKIAEQKEYNLLETLAEIIAKQALTYPIQKVKVRIQKPQALPGNTIAFIEIEREHA